MIKNNINDTDDLRNGGFVVHTTVTEVEPDRAPEPPERTTALENATTLQGDGKALNTENRSGQDLIFIF